MRVLLRIALAALGLAIADSCATQPKEVRPQLQNMSPLALATGELAYVFPTNASRLYEAAEILLRAQFPLSYVRSGQKADLDEFGKYGELKSDYQQYTQGSDKYRKRCTGYVHVIQGYPSYSKLTLGCQLEIYELGLIHGRGGIHNVFTQWWDWYPEQGMYVAEDLLEMVRQKLGLKEDEVIRLNGKDFYTREEVLQRVRDYEAQRQKK